MIVDEKKQDKLQDLLSACEEQVEKIHRIIIEVEPGFERSKIRALLKSEKWPCAIHPNLIIDNQVDEDMFARAENILDVIIKNTLQDKKFLDFGCGEGHVALKASERASLSVGYDICELGWDKFRANDRFLLTSDFQEVFRHGLYDFILLYDVMDHLKENPIDVLKDLRAILKDDGKVFIRFHPWCSRHGTHAYKSCNKAFIHYFFSDDELNAMGVKTIPTLKIIHPLTTYDDWILKAGFKKLDLENIVRESPEPFFEKEEILSRIIKNHWKTSYEERLSSGKVFPRFQLEQSFIDMILIKSS